MLRYSTKGSRPERCLAQKAGLGRSGTIRIMLPGPTNATGAGAGAGEAAGGCTGGATIAMRRTPGGGAGRGGARDGAVLMRRKLCGSRGWAEAIIAGGGARSTGGIMGRGAAGGGIAESRRCAHPCSKKCWVSSSVVGHTKPQSRQTKAILAQVVAFLRCGWGTVCCGVGFYIVERGREGVGEGATPCTQLGIIKRRTTKF